MKNKRRGPAAKSCSGVKLPLFTKQACGHVFNSAGSPACIHCLRAKWYKVKPQPSAKSLEMYYFPDALRKEREDFSAS